MIKLMPLCSRGQINLCQVEIILFSLSFWLFAFIFPSSSRFATFLSLVTLFDCSK